MQEEILRKKIEFYVIDGYTVAREAGMGNRINTIMQTCFFAISGVLPREEAIAAIKNAIQETYGKRGEAVVQKNFAAVDHTLAHLHKVRVPERASSSLPILPAVSPPRRPSSSATCSARSLAGQGDLLPVSAMPADGTFPTGTAKWEKRNIAQQIPVWDKDLCIQCGKCVMVCPHAVIRAKVYDASQLDRTLPRRSSRPSPRGASSKACATRCRSHPKIAPAAGSASRSARSRARAKPSTRPSTWRLRRRCANRRAPIGISSSHFPTSTANKLSHTQVKDVQLLEPLFEFSGACAGCGETPYIKLLTQLFGDRLYIANATGCSSIYGGNLPTTPYTINRQGRGPTWSNSLFEDNAEFGFGMRLAVDQASRLRENSASTRLASLLGDALVQDLLAPINRPKRASPAQRERVAELKQKLARMDSPDARDLLAIADTLVRKSVWIVGGDGWAYDIGFGGLDHVLGSGKNVNVLVLDTEVYSNTGGQMSKATPRGAVAKFAAGGKHTGKKDLAMEAISYGSVYVAQVAMGGNDTQTVKAFLEAEAYDGPSLIIAYSHCIAHGYDMAHGLEQQKAAVQSGYWPLMRYNPALRQEGKNPFQLDSKAPTHSAQGICLSRGALHHAGAQQSGGGA